MTALRSLFEFAGVIGFFVLHWLLILLYATGAGLRGVDPQVFWSVLALGYVTLIVSCFFMRRFQLLLSGRTLVDLWLVAFLLAFLVTACLVYLKWPLRFSTGGGHGLAEGGEALSALAPWLHALLWSCMCFVLAKRIKQARSDLRP